MIARSAGFEHGPPRAAVAAAAPSRTVPRVTDFAQYPASWYLLGFARELGRGPLARCLFGRDLVAYRAASGRAVVMDARCAHLGADLARGTVKGECIECPFHGWRYGADGGCVHIPHVAAIPARARQTAYPVAERHGMIFAWNGPEPLFPLPFFAGERPEDLVPAPSVEFVADSPWFMVAAHGYDTQHFETVHGRRLLGPLAVDTPAPFARRSRYVAEVLGDAYYDRVLRWGAGRTVEITITTWGGTLVLITGCFPRARSRFLIAFDPIEGGRTRCRVVAFAPRPRGVLAHALHGAGLRLRRHFTGAYLLAEVASLGSPRYNPAGLTEADAEMVEYFRWAAALPAPGRGAAE